MSKKTFFKIPFFILLLLILIGIQCQQFSEVEKIGEAQIKIIDLSQGYNRPLYFVKKNWGYTGDHQIIALTAKKPNDAHWVANKSTDYVWEGEVLICYQQRGDTLNVLSNYLPDTSNKGSIKQIIEFDEIKGTMFNKIKQRVDTTIKVIE